MCCYLKWFVHILRDAWQEIPVVCSCLLSVSPSHFRLQRLPVCLSLFCLSLQELIAPSFPNDAIRRQEWKHRDAEQVLCVCVCVCVFVFVCVCLCLESVRTRSWTLTQHELIIAKEFEHYRKKWIWFWCDKYCLFITVSDSLRRREAWREYEVVCKTDI